MSVSDEFLSYVLDQFSGWGGVTARKMFGGAGLYRDGRMFGLVAGDVAYLKVDDSNREDFVQAGSSPFKPYPDKPTLMPYYEIPPGVLEQPEELAVWAKRSLAIPGRKSNLVAMECRKEAEWFCRARFGMFYHWGLYTGGGDSVHDLEAPFAFESAEAFEEAAPEPEVFAANLVGLTKSVGARYLTLTTFHTCGRCMLICPTAVPHFKYKTSKDYLGAVIEETHRQGLKFIAYFPAGMQPEYANGYSDEQSPEERKQTHYEMTRQLFSEWRDRYGPESIDGFWMDGYMDWYSVAETFPNAVRIGNNQTMFHLRPRPDFGTTEFQYGTADPAYNRAGGLRAPQDPNLPGWILAPRKDFNEDIPTCNAWWWHGKTEDNEYTRDPNFWVKEMICSLGQRRKWNYAMGLGPLLDGTAPEEFRPMIKAMADFMKWASPALIDTMGGECAPIQQGWLSANAFGTLTVPYDEDHTYYLLVTDPPKRGGVVLTDILQVQHDGVAVESITDLRTGDACAFSDEGAIDLLHLADWTDIDRYGARIFKIKTTSASG